MSPIKILLADDQQLIRDALGALLSLQADIEVAGSCGRGDQVLDLARQTQPDIVLLDIDIAGHGRYQCSSAAEGAAFSLP